MFLVSERRIPSELSDGLVDEGATEREIDIELGVGLESGLEPQIVIAVERCGQLAARERWVSSVEGRHRKTRRTYSRR